MNRSLIFTALICGSSLSFGYQNLRAQGCCTPGTSSLGGAERGVATYHTLVASLNFQYNSLDRTYSGNQQVNDVLRRDAAVTILNLELEYGLAERVSAVFIGNYSFKRRQFTTTNAQESASQTTEFSVSGIGDLQLLVKYQLLRPALFSPFEISLGAGAKLPVGSYTRSQNGTRLALDLQPGTGAIDLIGFFYASRTFPAYRLSVYANLLYRYTGSNPDGYKLGNEWLPTLGAGYGITNWLEISLLARGRVASKDFAEGRFLPSTGGQMYSITPVVLYREKNVALRFSYQIPLYRNLKGTQLSLTNSVGVDLQVAFNFRGVPKLTL